MEHTSGVLVVPDEVALRVDVDRLCENRPWKIDTLRINNDNRRGNKGFVLDPKNYFG